MRLINLARVLVWIGRPRDRPITFEDLVDAQTEVLDAEEAKAVLEERLIELAVQFDARAAAAYEEIRHPLPESIKWEAEGAGDTFAACAHDLRQVPGVGGIL
jgi:hypothetical protein